MHENRSILIVDDEAFIRVLLVQALEELADQDVELLTASDGQEALDIALEHQPDLIFLDVMMPRLDGYEVCRAIKEADAPSYVVLLTAKGQMLDREKGKAMGADEYVTKPFDPDYILKRAAQVLDLEIGDW
jgi:CheY-like chemotaxis protein